MARKSVRPETELHLRCWRGGEGGGRGTGRGRGIAYTARGQLGLHCTVASSRAGQWAPRTGDPKRCRVYRPTRRETGPPPSGPSAGSAGAETTDSFNRYTWHERAVSQLPAPSGQHPAENGRQLPAALPQSCGPPAGPGDCFSSGGRVGGRSLGPTHSRRLGVVNECSDWLWSRLCDLSGGGGGGGSQILAHSRGTDPSQHTCTGPQAG